MCKIIKELSNIHCGKFVRDIKEITLILRNLKVYEKYLHNFIEVKIKLEKCQKVIHSINITNEGECIQIVVKSVHIVKSSKRPCFIYVFVEKF